MWLSNMEMGYKKGFTVQELLVAMLVSSLIIGMIYTIYAQLNKQLYAYRDSYVERMEYQQFKKVLATDVFMGHTVERYGSNSIGIHFRKDTYTYVFLKDMVVRNRNGVKDTFDIKIASIKMDVTERYISIWLNAFVEDEPILIYEAKETVLADKINKEYINEY
ncbi:MAG: hypothetical protein GYB37_15730 [Algicola sp.]|nr:hypothetical protein [Algicola sp.]